MLIMTWTSNQDKDARLFIFVARRMQSWKRATKKISTKGWFPFTLGAIDARIHCPSKSRHQRHHHSFYFNYMVVSSAGIFFILVHWPIVKQVMKKTADVLYHPIDLNGYKMIESDNCTILDHKKGNGLVGLIKGSKDCDQLPLVLFDIQSVLPAVMNWNPPLLVIYDSF